MKQIGYLKHKILINSFFLLTLILITPLVFCMDKNDNIMEKNVPLNLTRESAKVIAEQVLAKEQPKHEWMIVDHLTVEKEFGWVFDYTTKQYWKTKNPKFIVPGNGPLIIDRKSGAHLFLPTAIPPAKAIEEYEKATHKMR